MQAHLLSNRAGPEQLPFVLRYPRIGLSADSAAFPRHNVGGLANGSGLAHDAGNLLAALTLYCDLLQAPGVLRPEHRHYASELRSISDRSSALLRRLLDPDEAEAAAAKRADDWPHDGASCLLALQPLLVRLAAPCSVSVEVPSHAPLPFEATILERIVVNLVRNAASALQSSGRKEGSIRIVLREVAEPAEGPAAIELLVEDDGPGMDPATAAFLSPRPRRNAKPGHGFGHRIVHDLSVATGASLTLSVVPGQGTAFHFAWPCGGRVLCRASAASSNSTGQGRRSA